MAQDKIAVVGVGCRFPGADDLEGYWRVLSNGENHVREIPRERWDLDAVYDADPNVPRKTNVRQAGFVKDYHEWDHKLFGINEMEARTVDPQQRMVLDCVHMALEDGGIRRQDIDGSYIGVYIGSMNDDFKNQAMLEMDSASAYTMTGLHSSIISARVAYVYNLHGPAMTLDTACSSSLVAINVAEQALRQGSCDAAICGGANSILDAVQFVALSKTRMLSPTGQSKPFSADADGYARGEGCGIIILKRLDDALRDGNKIWATLTTGCNQDGNTATPITAPSGSMQLDLLQRLYGRSKTDKHSVQVIEAHGTGTPVGDPIETNALGKFFGMQKVAKPKTLIGSVKSNIGHTEAAAGVAGLIKVLLMMKHGQVVPSLLLDKSNINPKIDFDKYGFDVPISVTTWPRSSNGRVAAVNSFGFGGTNSHAIVREYVHSIETDCVEGKNTCHFPQFVTLSAMDHSSLLDQVKDLSQKLKSNEYDLRSLSYTSTCRRDHRPIRKAFFSDSQNELIQSCDMFLKKTSVEFPLKKSKVVFVFCGVGTTWQGMCTFMMQLDAFKESVQEIDKILLPLSGWTLARKFSDGDDVTKDPLVSHVAIFGCQVGLVEVWKSIGINPDLVVGQSVGEVAAAFTSGSIDLKSAVHVIYYRSKFLSAVREGAMAVVKNYDTTKIQQFCETTEGKLCIAVYLSPTSCTISGDKQSLDMIQAKLDRESGPPKPVMIHLDVTCAYHSEYVECASKMIAQTLTHLKPGTHPIPIISTVSGLEEKHTTFAKGAYWERNIRCAVRFGEAIRHARAISSAQPYVFLEIGPTPVLGAHMKALFENQARQVALPSTRKGSEKATMCNTICKLYEIGQTLNWEYFFPSIQPVTNIPVYVFRQVNTPFKNRQILTTTSMQDKDRNDHMYINGGVIGEKSFEIEVNETTSPFVFDHVVKGATLIPGAFYADIGYKIAQTLLGVPLNEAIVSLEFKKPARIEIGSENKIKVEIDDSQNSEISFLIKQDKSLICIGTVAIRRRAKEHETDEDTISSQGRQSFIGIEKLDHNFDIEQLHMSMIGDHQINMDSNTIYRTLNEMGFQHGRCFQIITKGLANECQSLATFAIPEDVFKDTGRTIVHPCILDGMLQSTLLATDKRAIDIVTQENLSLMPVAIQGVVVHKQPRTRTVYAYAKMTNSSVLPNVLKLHYDILLLNIDGTVIVEVKNYTTYCRRNNTTFTPDELKYKLSWSQASLNQCAPSTPKILFINARFEHEIGASLVKDNIALCNLQTNHITEEMLSNALQRSVKAKWRGIDEVEAIVLFLGRKDVPSDIDHVAAEGIYSAAKHNCMVITWLLKFLKDSKQVPLLITTENTQALDSSQSSGTNVFGSEAWGFIRNILVEFVHDKVALVDLQPSLEETISTFFNLLASALKDIDSTQIDYIIRGNTVLGGTFSKTPMTEIMPSLKTTSVSPPIGFKGMVISEQKDMVVRPFIAPLLADQILREECLNSDSVEIEVTSVSLHDNSIFPTIVTSSGQVNGFVGQGHPIIAVEYVGFESSASFKRHIFRSGTNSVAAKDSNSADRWSTAVVYPQQIQMKASVPRSCTVNLRKLPFYKPNMLTYAILFWNITSVIRKGSVVTVQSKPPHDGYTWLLEQMLKRCTVSTTVNLENKKQPDTIVLLGTHDEIQSDATKHATTIVAFKYTLSNGAVKNLRIHRQIDVIEIDTHCILSNKEEVRKTLQKVVPWLKQNISPNDSCRIHTMPDKHVSISGGVQHRLELKLSLEDHLGAHTVFIITGGITGLGWKTVLMLVEKGVGVIATLSRREIDLETKKTIVETEKQYGCKIRCFRGNVCDLQAVSAMIEELKADYGSNNIRGIVHGAGVLASHLFDETNEAKLNTVMGPKVLGVMNLHIASKGLPIEFFIMQSSISSIMGMAGQGNYGAANAFLDAFARWRRSKGLAAQSINWGALDVGMAVQTQLKTYLVKRGFDLLSIAEIRNCFVHAMMQNETSVVYANLDWSKIVKDLQPPHMARIALTMKKIITHKNVDKIRQDNQTDHEEYFLGALKVSETDDETRKRNVEKFVVAVTKRTLGSDVETLTMDNTFVELGMESLAAVTFSNVVFHDTGYRIAQDTLFSKSLGDAVAEICSHVTGKQSIASIQTYRM